MKVKKNSVIAVFCSDYGVYFMLFEVCEEKES